MFVHRVRTPLPGALVALALALPLCIAGVINSNREGTRGGTVDRDYAREYALAKQRILVGRGYSQKSRSGAFDVIEQATLNAGHSLEGIVEGDVRVCSGECREQRGRRPHAAALSRSKRQVVSTQYYNIWESKTVRYAIDADSYGSAAGSTRVAIRQALDAWESKTRLLFVEIDLPTATEDEDGTSGDYLRIYSGNGCWSYIGRIGGAQNVSLSKDNCIYKGVIMHEIGHALGLIHEQSRPDRERYVRVLPQNVVPGLVSNFLLTPAPTVKVCTPYNVESVMHYGTSDFGANGQPTLIPRSIDYVSLAGYRGAATHYDYKAICCLYDCQGDCTNSCDNDGYAVQDAAGACTCACPYALGGPSCSDIDRSEFTCGGVVQLDAGGAPYRLSVPQTVGGGKCAWLFKAPAGAIIKVSFRTFNVAVNAGQCLHYVELRRNLVGQSGAYHYCGAGTPDDIYSRSDFESNAALLIFDYSATAASASSTFSADVASYTDGCLGDPCRGAGCRSSSGSASYNCSLRSDGFICGFESSVSDSCAAIRLSSSADNFTATFQRPWEVRNAGSTPIASTQGLFFIASGVQGEGVSRGTFRIIPYDFKGAPRCLKFQYLLESVNAGTLNVYRSVNGVLGSPVFTSTASPDTVGRWLSSPPIEIAPPPSRLDLVEVIFESYGDGDQLDDSIIAIDDVRYLPGKCLRGACESEPCGTAKCTEGEATEGGQVVTGIDYYTCSPADLPDYDASCNFEDWEDCSALVDLRSLPGDKATWRLRKGAGAGYHWPFSTGPAGPAVGVAYAYAQLYNGLPKDGARMKLLAFTGNRCVMFKFCMNGVNVGTLKVYRAVDGHYDNASLLWAAYGPQGAQWLQAAVNVTTEDLAADARVEVVIEAVHGDSQGDGFYAADVAIDAVLNWKGTCDHFAGTFAQSPLVVPTTARPTTTAKPTTAAKSCVWGWVLDPRARVWNWKCL